VEKDLKFNGGFMEKFYVTTPIYYVNDKPHLGHAYTTVAADVIARFNRFLGREVFFLTGTDEHGQKIQQAAEKKGMSPKEFVDSLVPTFKKLWEKLNVSNDHFVRTTDPYHVKAVQHIFMECYKKGDIYLGEYEGWYCVPCETYYTEKDLLEGKLCPACKREVTRVKEESYFFRLSRYQEKLLKFYEENPEFIAPEFRRNEVINFVKQGLKDLSISRTSFSWGIPVPVNEKHVIYVWFDALTNYLSAVGYPDDEGRFSKFWPADLHLVGKDILRFHAVYWPAFLMSAGLPLPKRVFAHGWWTVEGEKMSKSKRNVIDPFELVELFGVDQVRFFLFREVSFGLDGDFSYEKLVNRINGELANDLGNLFNRTLSMLKKYRKSVIPEPKGEEREIDLELKERALSTLKELKELIPKGELSKALEEIWKFVGFVNYYIDRRAPWQLNKEGKEELDRVLYNMAEALRFITAFTYPYMPNSSQKMADLLNLKTSVTQLRVGEFEKWGGIQPGETVEKGGILFPRIEFNPETKEVKIARTKKG